MLAIQVVGSKTLQFMCECRPLLSPARSRHQGLSLNRKWTRDWPSSSESSLKVGKNVKVSVYECFWWQWYQLIIWMRSLTQIFVIQSEEPMVIICYAIYNFWNSERHPSVWILKTYRDADFKRSKVSYYRKKWIIHFVQNCLDWILLHGFPIKYSIHCLAISFCSH